jgi:peptidoglycan hydrolase-like protein with peptidoglycan-binding domain
MSRYRRSFAGPFGTGLLMAGLVTAACVGVHHMWAPPAPEDASADATSVLQSARLSLTATVEQVFGAPRQAMSSNDGHDGTLMPGLTAAGAGLAVISAPVPVDVGTANSGAGVEASARLTRTIQAELQRVGCYTGRAHGTWDQSTRSAMLAFAAAAGVGLRVSGPEWVLLTVLQGQNGPACARPCSTPRGEAATCAPSRMATVPPPAAPGKASLGPGVQEIGTLQYSAVPVATSTEDWSRDARLSARQSSIETGAVQPAAAMAGAAVIPAASGLLAKPSAKPPRAADSRISPAAEALRDVSRVSP